MAAFPLWSLAALAVLIAANAVFSALEVAFLSISRIRLHRLLERSAAGAPSLARLKVHPERTIIAILIGSNLASVAASVLAADIAVQVFGDIGLGIATGVMTLLLLTLGEVTPKTLASTHADAIALFSAPFLEVLRTGLSPVIAAFDAFNRAVAGPHASKSVAKVTEDEVRAVIHLGHQDAAISAMERHYIENVLHFNDKTVRQCMTPKERAVVFSPDWTVPEALEKALASAYSRFPVVQDGRPLGVVTLKRLMMASRLDSAQTVSDSMRKPVLLPEGLLANEAFSRMQAQPVNMALVVDGQGRFVGVVTLEDLLEELVGEIA